MYCNIIEILWSSNDYAWQPILTLLGTIEKTLAITIIVTEVNLLM